MESTWDSLDIPSTNLSSSSITTGEPSTFPLYLRIYVTTACVAIFLIGILGNALVPVLMWRSKELRHSTNVFLLNLALADALVLLICLPTSLVELHTIPNTWILGGTFCHLVPFVEVCVTRASVITLAVISMERYFAICCPLRSTSFCSRPKAFAVCLLIWPVSLLAAGPMFFITEYGEVDYGNGVNVSYCFTPITGTMKHYFIGSAILFFLIPLFFLSVIYFFITRQLLNQKSWMKRRADRAQWHARKQVSLMFAVVIAVFFICLIPFNAFTLWIIMVPDHVYNHLQPKIYYNLLFAFRILVYINSAANPIIYNVMSAKFRVAFCKLFRSHRFDSYVPRRRSTLTTTLSSTSSTSSRSNSLREITSHIFPRRLSEIGRRHSEKMAVNNGSPFSSAKIALTNPGVYSNPNHAAEENAHRKVSPSGPDCSKKCPAYCIDKLPQCQNANMLVENFLADKRMHLRTTIASSATKKVSFRDNCSLKLLNSRETNKIVYSNQEPIYDNWPPKTATNNMKFYV